MRVASWPIGRVKPYDGNPRRIPKAAVKKVADSIAAFGFNQPLVVDADGVVVVGHTRLLAARRLKLQTVPVVVADLSEEQARAYRLADNRTHEESSWDDGLLRIEFDALRRIDSDFDFAGMTGFSFAQIDRVFAANAPAGKTDPDAVPAPRRAISKAGDIWQLGRHRIVCGDGADRDTIDRLMRGGSVDLVLTDPPYGLGDSATIKNRYRTYEDSPAALIALVDRFIPVATSVAPVVVVTPGNMNHRAYPKPTWTMAWFVPAGTGAGPWGFICWQPILCYGKDPKLAKGRGSFPDAIVHTETAEKFDHPCPKPIKFWTWLMERASHRGAAVLDVFLGTGTTIIAAETAGRDGYGIEIDPAYVDIAVERWQDFTGQKAKRITR